MSQAAKVRKTTAQPGDTIEIICTGTDWDEKQFTVIEPPEHLRHTEKSGDVWIPDETSPPSCVRLVSCQFYRIIETSRSDTESRNVDDFLKQQLNDNLSSIFE